MYYSEREVAEITGYSRMALQNFRHGGRQVQNGKVYYSEPILVSEIDWMRFARMVIYTEHGLRSIIAHRKAVQSRSRRTS